MTQIAAVVVGAVYVLPRTFNPLWRLLRIGPVVLYWKRDL